MKIGLLALQGNVEKHSQILLQLNFEPILVRYQEQLGQVSGLVIPGGESTTMSKLLDTTGLRQPIQTFAQQYPILGTCAGLIMLGNALHSDADINTFGLIDVNVTRNAYGRQLDSFVDDVVVNLKDKQETIPATFIRAPIISDIGPDVELLASYNNNAVAVRQGRHIGLTFHPELDDVTLFHQLAFST
ncbi:MAG: pyridoxal 5'-phosphate synthase glutaminase subunit PdxT [Piscirickettsiaceae bacterium]|nr:pyridoxal 5'-phosphate synthase glutaminase subunit PdxT [Piscirickettsiaceae bacterium]